MQEKLNNFVSFYSGLTYSPADVTSSKDGVLVLRSSNIENDKMIFTDNIFVKKSKVNSKYVEKNDLIVVVRNGSRPLLGKHALVEDHLENTVIGAFMTGIQSQSPHFVNNLLSTVAFKREIHKNLGATINQITNKNFRDMKFFIPNLEEANKIGELLKKLNHIITLEQEKLSALKKYNKYMIELFSNHLALEKNYNIESKKVKLQDVSPVTGGYAFKSKDFVRNLVPIIRITNINASGKVKGPFVSYRKTNSLTNYLGYPGQNVIAMSGATTGKSSIIQKKSYINQRVGIFKTTSLSTNEYINLVINSNDFQNYLNSIMGIGAQPNISTNDINRYEFYMPTEFSKLKHIGAIHQKIIDLIFCQKDKIELLKKLKRNLLNLMFV